MQSKTALKFRTESSDCSFNMIRIRNFLFLFLLCSPVVSKVKRKPVLKDVEFKEQMDIIGELPDSLESCIPDFGRPKVLYEQFLKVQTKLIKSYSEVMDLSNEAARLNKENAQLIVRSNKVAKALGAQLSQSSLIEYSRLNERYSKFNARLRSIHDRLSALYGEYNALKLESLRLENLFYISLKAGQPSVYALKGLVENFKKQIANKKETFVVLKKKFPVYKKQLVNAKQLLALVGDEYKYRQSSPDYRDKKDTDAMIKALEKGELEYQKRSKKQKKNYQF